MKKLFSILMVAFALMAMVACDKEDNGGGGSSDSTGTGGNNNNPTDTTATVKSYVIYDGVTYPMYNLDATHINSGAAINPNSGITAFWNQEAWPKNKTIDLASPAPGDRYWIGVDGSDLMLQAYGRGRDEDGSFTGFYTLFDENHDQESGFTSGTYAVYTADSTDEGEVVHIELDGMLKTGKRLQVHIVSGSNNGNNNQ